MNAAKTPETDEARDRCANCGLQFVPADVCEKLEAQRDALVAAMEAIEMETRDGGQWNGREINDVARAALKSVRGAA